MHYPSESIEMQIKLRDAQGAPDLTITWDIFRRQRDNKRAIEVYGNVEELLSRGLTEVTEARIRLASAFLEMGRWIGQGTMQ